MGKRLHAMHATGELYIADIEVPRDRVYENIQERDIIMLDVIIAGAAAVAITAKLMYVLFLGGKTISNAGFIGKAVGTLRTALVAFANGWSEQSFRYKLVAYPSMLASMGLTSLVIYSLIPVISDAAGFWDKFRYCLLIVLAGVPASTLGAFVIMYGIHLLKAVAIAWWRGGGSSKPDEADTNSA